MNEKERERESGRHSEGVCETVSTSKLFKNVWFNFLSGKPSPWSLFVRFELFFRNFWVLFSDDGPPHVIYARAMLRKYYYFAHRIHWIPWKLTRASFWRYMLQLSYARRQTSAVSACLPPGHIYTFDILRCAVAKKKITSNAANRSMWFKLIFFVH